MPRINKRKIISTRLPKNLLKDLEEITSFNKSNRTFEIERYIKEGIERSRRILKKRFVTFSIMILTLGSIGFYVWYLFNI